MRQRSNSGNMLFLTMLSGSAMVITIFVVFLFLFPHFMRSTMHNTADSLTLKTAQALNSSDQSGRMNNIVARCRELVFTSREIYNQARQRGYDHLIPLAGQLVGQARSSAVMLEDERQKLLRANLERVSTEVKTANAQFEKQSSLVLPGVSALPPQLLNVEVGYIKGVQSNVIVSQGNPDLVSYDMAQGFIQQESNLYMANINAHLPDPDSDLTFKLFPLPAPVKGTVAPARLTLPNVFVSCAQIVKNGKIERPEKVKIEQLPSAIKLEVASKIDSQLTGKVSEAVKVLTVAASDGAGPPP